MSIFGKPIGVCDYCGTNGLPLSKYRGQEVCPQCRDNLIDFSKVKVPEKEYTKLKQLIRRAGKNY